MNESKFLRIHNFNTFLYHTIYHFHLNQDEKLKRGSFKFNKNCMRDLLGEKYFLLNLLSPPFKLIFVIIHWTFVIVMLLLMFFSSIRDKRIPNLWIIYNRAVYDSQNIVDSSNKFRHFFASIIHVPRLISCSFKLNVNVNHSRKKKCVFVSEKSRKSIINYVWESTENENAAQARKLHI